MILRAISTAGAAIRNLVRKKRLVTVCGLLLAAGIAAGVVCTLRPWRGPEIVPAASVQARAGLRVKRLRGVFISAVGKTPDFPSKPGLSAAARQAEAEALMTRVQSWGFNAVFLETAADGEAVYASDVFAWAAGLSSTAGKETGYDELSSLVAAAHRHGLRLYACVSPLCLGVKNASALPASSIARQHPEWLAVDGDGVLYLNPGIPAVRDLLARETAHIVNDAHPDGVVLDGNVYPSGTFGDAASLRQYGNGKTAEAFRRASADALVKACCGAVCGASKSVRFGVTAAGVWANRKQDARGSDTFAGETALFSHASDVLGWMKNGWLDFVVPLNGASLTDKSAPFGTAAHWWAAAARDTGVELYAGVRADRTCTAAPGWACADQLLLQMRFLAGLSGCDGCAVCGYGTLLKNPEGLTDALVKWNRGKQDASLGATLAVSSPQDGFFTNEAGITVSGTSDLNFPLTLDGVPVTRSAGGYFSCAVSLRPGENTLTLRHKGLTKTLHVTYSVNVLLSVEPAGMVCEYGGTQVSLLAAARKGATVTAAVNGVTLTLAALSTVPDGSSMQSLPAGYACYSAVYTLPDSAAAERSLGHVRVTAVWNGLRKTLEGGELRVKAAGALPSGKRWVAHLKVKDGDYNSLYIETYRYNDDLYRPDTFPQLPGTWDYVETNTDGSPKIYLFGDLRYYRLTNGELIYTDNAELRAETAPAANRVMGVSVSSADGGRYTRFAFVCSSKVTFAAGTSQSYPGASENTAGRRNYSISSFSADSFQLTLYNTTEEALPGSFQSPLIARAVCEKPTATSVRYTFYFRHAGVFYGTYLSYDGTRLTVDFKNPWDGSLKTLRIAIDPGHCAEFPGAEGFGGVNEKDINLRLALALRQKLTALGVPSANIFLSRTGDSYPYAPIAVNRAKRNVDMIDFHPDVALCIHCNAQDGSEAGAESYYFQPFSEPLAKSLQAGLLGAYGLAVSQDHYKPYAGMGNDRGAIFTTYDSSSGGQPKAYYSVRQFETPSCLVECGFVDNPEEFAFLNSSEGVTRISSGLLDGILNFMSAQKTYR